MFIDETITTAMLTNVFAEQIAAFGGKVSDTFDDGTRLFLRSILPGVQEVQKRDNVQGGVALRSNGTEVLVHPYTFRQVCKNGAIMAHAIQTRRVMDLDVRSPDEILPELREAIRACGAPEAFQVAAEQMRSAVERNADLALSFMSLLGHFPASVAREVVLQFVTARDMSVFGVMNAITAVARETPAPETRWNLEELGGGVIAASPTRPPRLSGSAARRREVVAAGSSSAWD